MSACACYKAKWCNITRSECTHTFVLYAWILYLNRKQDQDLDSMYSAILLKGVSHTTATSSLFFFGSYTIENETEVLLLYYNTCI